jgi:hypothetical protein
VTPTAPTAVAAAVPGGRADGGEVVLRDRGVRFLAGGPLGQ